jgi:hypothetical protein
MKSFEVDGRGHRVKWIIGILAACSYLYGFVTDILLIRSMLGFGNVVYGLMIAYSCTFVCTSFYMTHSSY